MATTSTAATFQAMTTAETVAAAIANPCPDCGGTMYADGEAQTADLYAPAEFGCRKLVWGEMRTCWVAACSGCEHTEEILFGTAARHQFETLQWQREKAIEAEQDAADALMAREAEKARNRRRGGVRVLSFEGRV